ncbi:MAG: N-acetylmuramoyl-L-alanine amidase [Phycisphaerae bacterium]|nr:N-acetylmuramoyl-L-alanine amidase [Phycisphaerae bacterium]
MNRLIGVSLILMILTGCAAPGTQRRGSPPNPLLATKPARAYPTPRTVPLQPTPTPRVEKSAGRMIGPKTIVIDPGHGGRDPGAPGVGPQPEKVVNLAIANKLAAVLKQRGANVICTRTADTFPTLDERAALADRHRADLFVSIHADSARRADASGATVYLARNATTQSRSAGQNITMALERAGIASRGVQRAGYRVLVGHSRPAVLVECGFLSNRTEAAKLATSSYQDRIANAIAEGVTDHFVGGTVRASSTNR